MTLGVKEIPFISLSPLLPCVRVCTKFNLGHFTLFSGGGVEGGKGWGALLDPVKCLQGFFAIQNIKGEGLARLPPQLRLEARHTSLCGWSRAGQTIPPQSEDLVMVWVVVVSEVETGEPTQGHRPSEHFVDCPALVIKDQRYLPGPLTAPPE